MFTLSGYFIIFHYSYLIGGIEACFKIQRIQRDMQLEVSFGSILKTVPYHLGMGAEEM